MNLLEPNELQVALLLASGLMGAALYGANLGLARYFEAGQGVLTHAAALAALVGTGALAYAAAAQITGAVRLSMLRRAFSGT